MNKPRSRKKDEVNSRSKGKKGITNELDGHAGVPVKKLKGSEHTFLTLLDFSSSDEESDDSSMASFAFGSSQSFGSSLSLLSLGDDQDQDLGEECRPTKQLEKSADLEKGIKKDHECDPTDRDVTSTMDTPFGGSLDEDEPLAKIVMTEKQRKRSQRFLLLFVLISALISGVLGMVLNNGRIKDSAQAPPIVVPTLESYEVPTGSVDLLLKELPESTLANLDDPSTVQWQAMGWLKGHPQLPGMSERRKKQLFALASLFYSLDGPNWSQEKIRERWLSYTLPECLWFSSNLGVVDVATGRGKMGVPPDAAWVDEKNTIHCNEKDHIQVLSLRDVGLSQQSNPSIPPEITLLSTLRVLILDHNDISASFEDLMEAMPSQLERLSIADNSLTGTIPTRKLLQMERLEHLSLSKNHLTGELCSELGILTSLQSLELHTNSFTGPIPSELGMLDVMADASLMRNSFSGSLPSFLPKNVERLELLGNQITGHIPTQIGLLSNLEYIGLAENALNGPLPSQLGMLTMMEHIYLYDNLLTGFLPTEIGLLGASFSSLQVFNTSLKGTIPSELGLLTNMNHLRMHANSMMGTLPIEMASMTNMNWLQLNDNFLSGSVPSFLSLLPKVQRLYLHNNSFAGTLPPVIGSMDGLSFLRLDQNLLSGPLPKELGLLGEQMEMLLLHSNSFSGSIPTELGVMSRLLFLSLGFNAITGQVPTALGLLEGLVELNIAHSMLTGTIPSELAMMTSLTSLHLDGNALSGNIPSVLGSMTMLTSLLLSSNNITSTIPEHLNNLMVRGSLQELILANNTLSGAIPEKLCSLGRHNGLPNGLGLSFDCSERLCGCCWCPCPGSNYSSTVCHT